MMKKSFAVFFAPLILSVCIVSVQAQPADSPEAAGITPVTGDMAPWRAYGYDMMNIDPPWVLALPDGNIIAMKRATDMATPGVVGGTEFLMFSPAGELLTPLPVQGCYEPDGSATPLANYAGTGMSWGAFTLGGRVDKANRTGFVLNHWMEYAESLGNSFGDVLGDGPASVIQLFNADGTPNGTGIAPFGALTTEGPNSDDWRDIGAAILSNGNVISIAEDRQSSDSLLDSIGAAAGEVAVAVIVDTNGETVVPPFAVHTGEDGMYLGGSSSMVYSNVVAFDGGFVIDHGAGIRWYNNDGTPRTPSQPDFTELAEEVIELEGLFFDIGLVSDSRGDGRGIASNGSDTVVRTYTVESEGTSIGILVYYNTDGTIRNYVRFDDRDFIETDAIVDRTFCDIDVNGNVFVVWQDNWYGTGDGFQQDFGRFFDAEGNPAGPSFPVYENWSPDGRTVESGLGTGGAGSDHQPRCALNNKVGAVIDGSLMMPDIDPGLAQLSAAFGLVLDEAVIRIFENPFDTDVESWSIY